MPGQPILSSLDNVVEDTTPQLGGTLDSNAHQISWSKGSDVASGTALTLGTDGNYFDITGTTSITSIGTLGIGTVVVLHFDGALTLTHQATDLILPGGANITTAAGDEAMFVEYASGDWRCVSYAKADGTAVVEGGLSNIVEDTTPQLGGTLDSNAHQVNWSKGSDVASAGALTLGTDGNYFDITGTTTITSIATLGIGTVVVLHFDGALTLTHHAADLTLPGGANITTAAGDEAMFVEYATGDWRCVSYTKADGTAVAGGGATLITKSIADIATDINGFSLAAVPAGMMNAWTASLNASIFNEAGLTAPNAAAICNEAGFSFANKALMFREAGLSIANINTIIIHANITDDNAQQILSEITKANRDLTSADNICEILDDWDDNKLTGRDGADTISTGFTNLFAHKDKFRPEWTTVAGAPSATGGKALIEVNEAIKIASTFNIGTWEIDCQLSATYASGSPRMISLYLSAGEKYGVIYDAPADPNMDIILFDFVDVASVILSSGNSLGTDNHTLKITRDGSSGWELFLDGGSLGTATDSTTTTFDEIHINNDAAPCNANLSIDNLKVY